MKVTTGTIVALVMGLIMLTVMFSVMRSIVPTVAVAIHNVSGIYEYTNDTRPNQGESSQIYGTDAATFGATLDNYGGWFIVVGILGFTIYAVVNLFLRRR